MSQIQELQSDHKKFLETKQARIKACKENIATREDYQRLLRYPPFKKLVLKGLFEETALRLVSNLADDAHSGEKEQATLHNYLNAISEVQHYFRSIDIMGKNAEEEIKRIEQEIKDSEEILAEEISLIENESVEDSEVE